MNCRRAQLSIVTGVQTCALPISKSEAVTPVPVTIDNWARLQFIVKTALLHRKETEAVSARPPQEILFDWEPDF